jgi:hypothetical protein
MNVESFARGSSCTSSSASRRQRAFNANGVNEEDAKRDRAAPEDQPPCTVLL